MCIRDRAFTLRRNDLDECMAEFPTAEERVLKAARKITLQRALLKYLCETVSGRPVRSFVQRSCARGFSEVRSELTVEQKLDILLRDRDEALYEKRQKQLAEMRKAGSGGAFGGAFAPIGLNAFEGSPTERGSARVSNANGGDATVVTSIASEVSSISSSAASPQVGQLAATVDALSARQEAGFKQMRDAHASLAAQLEALTKAVAAMAPSAAS